MGVELVLYASRMQRLLPLLALLCGCTSAGGPTAAALKSTASEDLRCPEAKLTTEKIDDRSQFVTGCGERLLYLYECGDDRKCGWKMRDARH